MRGLCEGSWYRQVPLGPLYDMQLPDSLNICCLSAQTEAYPPSSKFNHPNQLILALNNSELVLWTALLKCWVQEKLLLTTSKWILDEVISSLLSKPVHLKDESAPQQVCKLVNNKDNLILCSAVQPPDCSKVFLEFTQLKTEGLLFSVTPQPRRRWWDESVAKIGALLRVRVCVQPTNTQSRNLTGASSSGARRHFRLDAEQPAELHQVNFITFSVFCIKKANERTFVSQQMQKFLKRLACLLQGRQLTDSALNRSFRGFFPVCINSRKMCCLTPVCFSACVGFCGQQCTRWALSLPPGRVPPFPRRGAPQQDMQRGQSQVRGRVRLHSPSPWRESKENRFFGLSSQPTLGGCLVTQPVCQPKNTEEHLPVDTLEAEMTCCWS